MAHFIELTDRDNEKFLVNKDWITGGEWGKIRDLAREFITQANI